MKSLVGFKLPPPTDMANPIRRGDIGEGLEFDEENKKIKVKTVLTKRFVTNIGDGSSKEFVIKHGLDCDDIVFQCTRLIDGASVILDWQRIDANNIKVFIEGNAPSTNSLKVVII